MLKESCYSVEHFSVHFLINGRWLQFQVVRRGPSSVPTKQKINLFKRESFRFLECEPDRWKRDHNVESNKYEVELVSQCAESLEILALFILRQ
jgi:hypothetical protein